MESGDAGFNDYDDVPLHHQRPFGSGLKRKPIAFVPASSGELNTVEGATKPQPDKSIGDLYLSLVLPKPPRSPGGEGCETADGSDQTAQIQESHPETQELCAVCKLPLVSSPAEQQNPPGSSTGDGPGPPPRRHHESSLAHQVCLAHSHPPSALDRSRMGLTYLESFGWDPDARQGLGAAGQGIQFPLRARPKNDTLGLGVVVPPEFRVTKEKKSKDDGPRPLDAKRARAKAREDRRKADRLRDQFYGGEDLERYLGSATGGGPAG